jgi:hypothetical protein
MNEWFVIAAINAVPEASENRRAVQAFVGSEFLCNHALVLIVCSKPHVCSDETIIEQRKFTSIDQRVLSQS